MSEDAAFGPSRRDLKSRRVLFIQFGHYYEAYQRLAAGGEETYYAQRSSVANVAELARHVEDVCVLCVNQDSSEQVTPEGVRSLGFALFGPEPRSVDALLELARKQSPTHVILCVPLVPVFRWAASSGIAILPLLADSFLGRGPRQWLRRRRLVAELNRPNVEWVGNHNINASKHLGELGVNRSKIVPWDWPAVVRPHEFAPKQGLAPDATVRMIYVGALSEKKGTGDVIRALAQLRQRGRNSTLSVAGGGERPLFEELARTLGVADSTMFLGLVPHPRVLELMRAHDVVVVPSRHSYSEALPMTIYEAYCSRTPLVASDHPMFRDKVVDRVSGLTFRASDPGALTDRIEELVRDRALYERLSQNSADAWERLQCPVKHDDLYLRWLSNTDEDRRWLADHALASGRYT
jgi:glycosyltransferase involved in cell wall biosynthesis